MPDTSHISVIDIPAPTTGNSKMFSFATNSAADCLGLYVVPSQRDQSFKVQITDSSHNNFPAYQDASLYYDRVTSDNFAAATGDLAFSLPISEGPPFVQQGAWTGLMKYDATMGVPDLKVAQRINLPGSVARLVLPVNLVLYSSAATAQKRRWIAEELKTVARVLEKASINCQFNELQVLPAPEEVVTDDFWSAATKQLVLANAQPDQLTVLLIDDLVVKFPNEAGRAGGVPGPQGFVNQFAAVLVRLRNDANDPLTVNPSFLGLTIAHEIGHYLGLTHASAGSDRTNLMFATLGGRSTGSLNPQQIFILQRMPLVQIEYAPVAETPLTQIKVIIQTGTSSPSWADGPGTDMNIEFSLGDGNSFQTWDLNSWGNDFESGATDTFDLTGINNLYLETVTTWKITCSWSADMYIPFIGGPDDWNFARLTLVLNGGVTTDEFLINQVLSYQTGRNTVVRKFR